ncbi:DUF2975 domain-containing protein [Lactobacillus sp. LC28-10]|uniref:DUF2975 domain-containing protein n=1 Tax=Secundilactobacillus angelensis TaxID=2722706 RepID=A0ABX1KXP9_9LACO|nr:DUF2975 domain-containing protein [Secundilactobacillus angelensis]MCH5461714.1 DUF2975 domain-containing protein [Secundilactobacillus angelensis]NLR18010.1 DUF2975 domain-containing protein [Secundilactobacillus angelensis]
MRKGTWFLRLTLGGLALLVIAVGIIPFPIMLREMFTHAPNHLNIVVIILGTGIYLAIIGFLAAVLYAEKLLSIIDHQQAFSATAVDYLNRLKWSLVVVTAGVWLWLPFIFAVTQLDDAPGLLLIGLVIAAVPLILTVFMAVLVRLWKAALQLKNENDLTV